MYNLVVNSCPLHELPFAEAFFVLIWFLVGLVGGAWVRTSHLQMWWSCSTATSGIEFIGVGREVQDSCGPPLSSPMNLYY